MTLAIEYHLVLAETGGQLHPQLSRPSLLLNGQPPSSDAGWTLAVVDICSTCLMILRRHEELSLVWPSRTAHMVGDQRPLSFPLCDPLWDDALTATGHRKKNGN